METLFLHKENATETDRNAQGKGWKKNTIQNPYCGRRDCSLWLKPRRSPSPYFSKDATSREHVMSCRGKDGGAGGPGVPGREGGTKEGKEQTRQ